MEKYINDFLSGDSRSWTLKHYAIYLTITIMLAISHGFIFGLIRAFIF